MYYTDDELLIFTLDVLEEALETSEKDLSNYTVTPLPDVGFGNSVDIEIDFCGNTFMKEYYQNDKITLTVGIECDRAKMSLLIGYSCKNPSLANEYVDRYMKNMYYSQIWYMPLRAERDCGLRMDSEIFFESLEELRVAMTKRLALFKNDRFTNELRPFIHYFDVKKGVTK